MNDDFVIENVKTNIHNALTDPTVMKRISEGTFSRADFYHNGFLTLEEVSRLTKDFLGRIKGKDLLSDQQVETIFKESLLEKDETVMDAESFGVFLKIMMELIYEFL